MEIFMEHWLSFIAGGFLLAMILYGHYRGFLRIAVTVASLVLSIAIAHMVHSLCDRFYQRKYRDSAYGRGNTN